MHTNFNFKPCCLFTLNLHCYFSFPMHFHHSSHTLSKIVIACSNISRLLELNTCFNWKFFSMNCVTTCFFALIIFCDILSLVIWLFAQEAPLVLRKTFHLSATMGGSLERWLTFWGTERLKLSGNQGTKFFRTRPCNFRTMTHQRLLESLMKP